MTIKLSNLSDLQALQVIGGMPRALNAAIATFASLQPTADDVSIIINKSLLAPSYRSNPTVLAARVQSRCYEHFQDHSGWQTPDAPQFVTITLHRECKPSNERRSAPTPTAKRLIRDWLNLDLPRLETLDLPLDTIPPFLRTHPEQLTYQIYRELGTRISIRKLKTKWTIQRKS